MVASPATTYVSERALGNDRLPILWKRREELEVLLIDWPRFFIVAYWPESLFQTTNIQMGSIAK
jgi:hypothetical protein